MFGFHWVVYQRVGWDPPVAYVSAAHLDAAISATTKRMRLLLSLEHLAAPGGPLKREAADTEEYRGLLHSGRVRLKDARHTTNSLESRLTHAVQGWL